MIKTINGDYINPRYIERAYTRYDAYGVMLSLFVQMRGQEYCIAKVNTMEIVGGEAFIARQLEKIVGGGAIK